MIWKLFDADGDGDVDMKDVKKRSSKVASDVRERTISYLTAAFGLVAGLAWNEAIKGFIEAYYPLAQDSVMAKFIYALAVTLVLVIMTSVLLKLSKTTETKKKS